MDDLWGGSANVDVGHANCKVLDIEVAPDSFYHLYPEDVVITHSNHFEAYAVRSVIG